MITGISRIKHNVWSLMGSCWRRILTVAPHYDVEGTHDYRPPFSPFAYTSPSLRLPCFLRHSDIVSGSDDGHVHVVNFPPDMAGVPTMKVGIYAKQEWYRVVWPSILRELCRTTFHCTVVFISLPCLSCWWPMLRLKSMLDIHRPG